MSRQIVHRRTVSNTEFDFKEIKLGQEKPDGKTNLQKMIEQHQVPDSSSTLKALQTQPVVQELEKQVIIEPIDDTKSILGNTNQFINTQFGKNKQRHKSYCGPSKLPNSENDFFDESEGNNLQIIPEVNGDLVTSMEFQSTQKSRDMSNITNISKKLSDQQIQQQNQTILQQQQQQYNQQLQSSQLYYQNCQQNCVSQNGHSPQSQVQLQFIQQQSQQQQNINKQNSGKKAFFNQLAQQPNNNQQYLFINNYTSNTINTGAYDIQSGYQHYSLGQSQQELSNSAFQQLQQQQYQPELKTSSTNLNQVLLENQLRSENKEHFDMNPSLTTPKCSQTSPGKQSQKSNQKQSKITEDLIKKSPPSSQSVGGFTSGQGSNSQIVEKMDSYAEMLHKNFQLCIEKAQTAITTTKNFDTQTPDKKIGLTLITNSNSKHRDSKKEKTSVVVEGNTSSSKKKFGGGGQSSHTSTLKVVSQNNKENQSHSRKKSEQYVPQKLNINNLNAQTMRDIIANSKHKKNTTSIFNNLIAKNEINNPTYSNIPSNNYTQSNQSVIAKNCLQNATNISNNCNQQQYEQTSQKQTDYNLEAKIQKLEGFMMELKRKTDNLEEQNTHLVIQIGQIRDERDHYYQVNQEIQQKILELEETSKKNEENIKVIKSLLNLRKQDGDHPNNRYDSSTNIFTDISSTESPNEQLSFLGKQPSNNLEQNQFSKLINNSKKLQNTNCQISKKIVSNRKQINNENTCLEKFDQSNSKFNQHPFQ